jgi:hypothetical protein
VILKDHVKSTIDLRLYEAVRATDSLRCDQVERWVTVYPGTWVTVEIESGLDRERHSIARNDRFVDPGQTLLVGVAEAAKLRLPTNRKMLITLRSETDPGNRARHFLCLSTRPMICESERGVLHGHDDSISRDPRNSSRAQSRDDLARPESRSEPRRTLGG